MWHQASQADEHISYRLSEAFRFSKANRKAHSSDKKDLERREQRIGNDSLFERPKERERRSVFDWMFCGSDGYTYGFEQRDGFYLCKEVIV
jgi:hypothetical protein